MSTKNESQNSPIPPTDDENSKSQTPLELVKEQQAMQQENLKAAEQTPDPTPEIVGESKPSTKRHFPQKQLYDGK